MQGTVCSISLAVRGVPDDQHNDAGRSTGSPEWAYGHASGLDGIYGVSATNNR